MKRTKSYYEKYKQDACKYTKAVFTSDSDKKIIASGPGTGKSSLFGEICKVKIAEGKNKNLTLSFINELIDDLRKDIGHVSEVKTLHSFTLGYMPKHNKYYLDLEDVISKDYEIVHGKKINFKEILCRLINEKEALKFFFERRKYYGYYSPNSSVYILNWCFRKGKIKIPSYSQILIDEYQDFNKLESRLIDLLAKKSPIIIVGDDDQSLYGWKFADHEGMQTKLESSEYNKFDLPYCFRCSRVIVDAYSDIIQRAKRKGYLSGRKERGFEYYPSEKKDEISDKHEKIWLTKNVFKPANVADIIDRQIKELIDQKSKTWPTVLVIFPNKLKNLIPLFEGYLRRRGYKYIDSPDIKQNEESIKVLSLFIKNGNSKCNLSWRLASEQLLDKHAFEKIIKKSDSIDNEVEFLSLLDPEDCKLIKTLRASLIKIVKNKEPQDITEDARDLIFDKLGYNPIDVTYHQLKRDFNTITPQRGNSYKNIPIKIATILGSKGLTRDFVFLANFDDRFILKNKKVTNEHVKEILVALTRAKRKVSILVSGDAVPTFINWINPKYIEEKKYI